MCNNSVEGHLFDDHRIVKKALTQMVLVVDLICVQSVEHLDQIVWAVPLLASRNWICPLLHPKRVKPPRNSLENFVLMVPIVNLMMHSLLIYSQTLE